MRKIVTAVSAAALSLSMLATAVPALAVTGYDSAYAGESAFVNISPGQTLNFQVFFANTGTTTWSRGTGTQVDLAACLSDKVTCNAVEAANASWNSGWLSSTRYASTVQTTTAPGALGTFSYNIAAPANVVAGTYRFNGDLVLSSTGERIHPEGYYQDATVGGGAGAATLTTCTDSTSGLGCSGTSAGGDTVVLGGTGFVCTPAFPAVSFGGTNAAVSSCGSTSVTTTSPAHATGSVTITLTNSGSAASNGLTYTYVDLTPPTFTAAAVAADIVTVTYSEPVCRSAASAPADWNVQNVASGGVNTVTFDTTPQCTSATDFSNAVTTGQLFLTTSMPPGAFVEVDLLTFGSATRNSHIHDQAGNTIKAPQAQTATATAAPTTAPTMSSASGAVGSTTVVINFSQPVYCTGLTFGEFKLDDNNASTVDPTFSAFGSDACGATRQAVDSSFSLTTSTALPAATTYTLTFTPLGSNEIRNIYNVSLANNPATATVSFTTGAADFTPPTMIDARMANNLATTDFNDAGDSFTVTFSEKMNGATTGQINIQDQDGTTGVITCGGNATCVWDTNVVVLTVTLTATVNPTAGTTPGMQIPFNITALTVITDVAGNPPNVLGSSDRLVDFE